MSFRTTDFKSRRVWLARVGAALVASTVPGFSRVAFGQDTLALKKDTILPTRRLALLIGCAAYIPENRSILCSRKNVADVGAALQKLRFEVTPQIDAGAETMRSSLRKFFADARSDQTAPTLALFYFSGHGIQYQGKNLIVPSDVSFNQSTDRIARASVNIDDEMIRAIEQQTLSNGDFVLIFDACRTDPLAVSGDRDGANQVIPPRGTVISYATAPGKAAIAPKSGDLNSFYTAALVDELGKADREMSIKDFLDAVKFRVNKTMKESSEPFLRANAQDPEVAANLSLRLSLAIETDRPTAVASDAEQAAWRKIEATTDPTELLKLLAEFVETFKTGRFVELAKVRFEQATIAARTLQRVRVRLDPNLGDDVFRADQQKALLESDKYAALRVATAFERGTHGVPRDDDKKVQWLRHASELGNGIASYQLHRHYLGRGIDREAVRFRKLAIDQGYNPPPEIDSRRG